MTKIAALFDIHGNLPALEAVLADVQAWDAELVVVGGDVLPGPMPEECLQRLQALRVPVRWIRGNGDVDTVAAARSGPPARVPESFHPVMRWVAERTPTEWIDAIEGWPLTVSVSLGLEGEVLFCHATPRDENEIFTVNSPDEVLRDAFGAVEAHIVVCGHTHMPFDRLAGEIRVINAGSVGMPFGDTAAQWLALGPDGPRPMRAEYDLGRAADLIRATGYPIPMDPADPPQAEVMLASFDRAVTAAAEGNA